MDAQRRILAAPGAADDPPEDRSGEDRRQPETEARAEAERNLLDVVAGATETAAAVQRTAVTALLDLGGIAIAGDDGTATRRYTSGAVEDTLRWTAVHPAANAEAMLAARASLRAAEPADEDRVM